MKQQKSAIGSGEAIVLDEIKIANTEGLFVPGVLYVGFAADPALGFPSAPFVILNWSAGGAGFGAIDNNGLAAMGLQIGVDGGVTKWMLGDGSHPALLRSNGLTIQVLGLTFVSADANDLTLSPVRTLILNVGGVIRHATLMAGGGATLDRSHGVYELTAQSSFTLDDAVVQDEAEFEFVDRTGAASTSPHTFTPTAKTINGGASYNFNQNWGRLHLRKCQDGNWVAST